MNGTSAADAQTHHALKCLDGGRALDRALSKYVTLYRQFQSKYGNQYRRAREYYQPQESAVLIEDVSPWLTGPLVADDETEAAF